MLLCSSSWSCVNNQGHSQGGLNRAPETGYRLSFNAACLTCPIRAHQLQDREGLVCINLPGNRSVCSPSAGGCSGGCALRIISQ